ncbi:MAG: hypothetical protein KDB79_06265 [Acidobacteria bacterium]|nr:hypothetical protein [Acidobacteriota bacterium]
MNLFENLVDELKEENLLEETVITTSKIAKKREVENEILFDEIPGLENSAGEGLRTAAADEDFSGNSADVDYSDPIDPSEGFGPEQIEQQVLMPTDEAVENTDSGEFADADPIEAQDAAEAGDQIVSGDTFGQSELPAEAVEDDVEVEAEAEASKVSGKEAYAQRMTDEVMSLDAVEHVVSGIEREQMRTVPNRYDVVPVKQALHVFLTEFKTLESPQPTESEATLRKEIEKWHTSLLNRDADIPTPLLRLYCEDSGLNSKSLGALARFYRNSPFSENVRSKFDLVITRYFADEAERNRREMNLERDEMIEALTKLYVEWSSVPVYSEDDEDSELVLAAFKFEDFINEAKKCRSFDELLTNGFFKRIKGFKKKTSENFFAPMLVASAVECNVAIGNRYVDLIEKERRNSGADALGERYGGKHDKSVSEATSKTLQLTDLLKETKAKNRQAKAGGKIGRIVSGNRSRESEESSSSGIYKAVMGSLILVGLLIFGYLAYSAIVGDSVKLSESEEKIMLERSFLHKFVKNSAIKEGTFAATVTDKWNSLSRAEKEEVVAKISALGKVKGYEKVELKDASGKVITSTLGTKVDFAK